MRDFPRDDDPGDEDDHRGELGASFVIRLMLQPAAASGRFRVTTVIDTPRADDQPGSGTKPRGLRLLPANQPEPSPAPSADGEVDVPVDQYLQAVNAERVAKGAPPHGPEWIEEQRRALGPTVWLPAQRYAALKQYFNQEPC
jgi:hypothetical protein